MTRLASRHDPAAVDCILAAFTRARFAGYSPGWYDDALESAAGIATEYGVPLAGVVGAMASLAPRVQWEKVVDVLLPALYMDKPRRAVFRRSWDYAVSVGHLAEWTDVLSVLPGPKTHDFARAIWGADSVAVVDVWAAKTAGYAGRWKGRAAEYATVQASFVEAARLLGKTPREVQEITWEWERNR